MSSRVRRMALGLATLTLLTSLFLVAQGFLGAPEALAACSERTWCDPLYLVELPDCCLSYRRHAEMYQTCYWREVDCTINVNSYYHGHGCWGSFCWP